MARLVLLKYTVHLRQNYTSVYSFGYEFRQQLKHRFSDRMSVVPNSNQFACKLAAQKWTRMSVFGRASALFRLGS